jgi:hypothetical protein
MRLAGCIALALAAKAQADSATSPAAAAATVRLAAIAPADDVRRALVIGVGGEVYEPDGKGAWVHRLRCSTATPLVAAGRAGDAVVALGDGVVYRWAANGWSAIRLVQHGKAVLGAGVRSLAAVGRQLFALDALTRGEPTRLAVAPGNIASIGVGARGAVVATDAGVFRLAGTRFAPIAAAPRGLRLLSARWALADRGAFDLATGKLTSWPAGISIAAAMATDDALTAVAAGPSGLELVTLRGGKLVREPLGITGAAVGVVVDRSGRAAVALADGRIAWRTATGWTTTEVTDEAPADRPGAPPAMSP